MRLLDALRRPGLQVVAEIKRRSPSAGELRLDADPQELAHAYERAGAAAVSVLVDERFAGSWDDLEAARRVTRLPLLAKGFFSTRADVEEAKRRGADALLLLLRDLEQAQATDLLDYALSLGLDPLLEVHDDKEAERALALSSPLIGVNARSLADFSIDRRRQLALLAQLHASNPALCLVAESGIESRAQAALCELAGADAVLVGSSLMRARDPELKLRELLARPLVKVCGLTRQEDVDLAVSAGADLCGFIFAPASPRQATSVLEVPETVLSVAVFVSEIGPQAESADLVQLYEPARGRVRGRQATLLWEGREVAQVWDLPWEEPDGQHLERAAEQTGRLMLAGRLGPDNVAAAVRRVRPWAVDAASRLEASPGVKDRELVSAYVAAARQAGEPWSDPQPAL